ncbi:hypothetical protein ACJIZ3_012615 [Penstemon smallii]|uniref:MADS-box domain-containing protein n=1 Tax=Penstemon smallii TaxID=265156 RepID=A0ABD3UQG4_9LAMI
MERKRTMGRQKIPIRKIEKEADCFATFSKRRLGLFKKASELCALCNIDMGIIVYSPTCKPFSFFHPTMEYVVNQCQNPNQQLDDSSRLRYAYIRSKIVQLSQVLDNLNDQIEVETEREKLIADKNKTRCSKGWWEGSTEGLNKEQVQQLTTWFQNLQLQANNRQDELKTYVQVPSLSIVPNHMHLRIRDMSKVAMEANDFQQTNQIIDSHVFYASTSKARETIRLD